MITFVFLCPNFRGGTPEGRGGGVITSGGGVTRTTFIFAHSDVATSSKEYLFRGSLISIPLRSVNRPVTQNKMYVEVKNTTLTGLTISKVSVYHSSTSRGNDISVHQPYVTGK